MNLGVMKGKNTTVVDVNYRYMVTYTYNLRLGRQRQTDLCLVCKASQVHTDAVSKINN